MVRAKGLLGAIIDWDGYVNLRVCEKTAFNCDIVRKTTLDDFNDPNPFTVLVE